MLFRIDYPMMFLLSPLWCIIICFIWGVFCMTVDFFLQIILVFQDFLILSTIDFFFLSHTWRIRSFVYYFPFSYGFNFFKLTWNLFIIWHCSFFMKNCVLTMNSLFCKGCMSYVITSSLSSKAMSIVYIFFFLKIVVLHPRIPIPSIVWELNRCILVLLPCFFLEVSIGISSITKGGELFTKVQM